MAADPVPKELRSHLEMTYYPSPKDETEKIIDDILAITEMAQDRKNSLHEVLERAARVIFRRFSFGEVSVGLKNRKDGKYKYDVLLGYRKDLELEYKRISYDEDDMVKQDRFPFIKTGRLSELDPIEGLPPEEKSLFNRQYNLGIGRKSVDEFHEGDYFDIWMLDGSKKVIGWFEISSPKSGKMPPREHIRWIELLASVCGSIIVQRMKEEENAKRH